MAPSWLHTLCIMAVISTVVGHLFNPGNGRKAEIAGTVQEFCQLETFEPQCWKNEVIVMEKAIYGRPHVGKCLEPDEVSIGQNPLFFGCYSDVIHLMHSKCSGRHRCSVRIPDAELERTQPCHKGLKMFLEVAYHCTDVVEEDRSCAVTLTSSPLHIATSSSQQSNINCGTKTQPWLLEAPAGQRINISLLDFTAVAASNSQLLTGSSSRGSSSNSGSCAHQYGYIIDRFASGNKNVSVCGGRSAVHLSSSNQLQIVLSTELGANFILRAEVIGCTDLIPPEEAWLKREDDKITIGCYTSRQTWTLTCVDGRWAGVLATNCSLYYLDGRHAGGESFVTPVENENATFLAVHQVTAIVAVAFAGLAVCLTIICCGVVCLRRFYAASGADAEVKSDIKYNCIQPVNDGITPRRLAAGHRLQASMSNPLGSGKTAAGRRCDVNINGTSDVIGSHVTAVSGQYFVLDPDAVNREAMASC